MPRIAIIKEVKCTPTGERQEFLCRLLDRSPTHAVVLYKIKDARRVGSLRLPRGALTYGYFWRGRPYNVYQWVRADGRTLGFYVNLAGQVHVESQRLRVRSRRGIVENQQRIGFCKRQCDGLAFPGIQSSRNAQQIEWVNGLHADPGQRVQ